MPDFISRDARDLIKKILNTDPETRLNFEQIKAHPWFNIYKREYAIPPGIIIGYNRIPVDEGILQDLERYDMSREHAHRCIDANKHNHVTTTYHLLLKKHLQAGGKSQADINSTDFDITLLEPKPRPTKCKNNISKITFFICSNIC
jgi:5'-AMP-activated protein kinase catalytic alpha subunit